MELIALAKHAAQLPRAAAPRSQQVRGVDTLRNDIVLLGMPSGAIMPADMGTIRVDIEIENPARPGEDERSRPAWWTLARNCRGCPPRRSSRWASSGTTSGTSGKPTGPFSSAGPAGRLSMLPANEPLTTSCSESPAGQNRTYARKTSSLCRSRNNGDGPISAFFGNLTVDL